MPTENEVGIQIRFDAINLLLTDTFERGFLSTIRQDYVKEGSVGVYAQQTAHWSDWCKTVVGIRGDYFVASNNAVSLPINSGHPAAFVPGPKPSMILGPFEKIRILYGYRPRFS